MLKLKLKRRTLKKFQVCRLHPQTCPFLICCPEVLIFVPLAVGVPE